MEMMNVIGYLNELDGVSSEIVKSGSVHIVNALSEINQNNFTIMTPEQNTNVLMDLNFIRQNAKSSDTSDEAKKMDEIMGFFHIARRISENDLKGGLQYTEIVKTIDSIYGEAREYKRNYEDKQEEIRKDQELYDLIEKMKGINVDIDVLKGMNLFSFSLGKFSKENYSKLEDNIENISSVIYEIYTVPGYHVVMSITPKVLEAEVDRIFKSLSYEEIILPKGLAGTPEEISLKIAESIKNKKSELDTLVEDIGKLKDKYQRSIEQCYSIVKLYEEVRLINNEVACTKEFFYMAGWVPVSEKENIKRKLQKFGNRLLVIFKPQSEVSGSIVPPTKLKNNWFAKPFEILVSMYGIPSYDEADPTFFVAISYMIMFGCMFGDIGQGFIFLLTGIFMTLKDRESSFGGILSRLGVSSMFFGAMFGSVFGNEDIFPHLLVRPLDNINAVLIGGIVIGVVFTTVSFVYSFINAGKQKNFEDGLFGKNGAAGFLFYWIILLTALSMVGGIGIKLPLDGTVAVLCVLLLLIVFKEPLAGLLTGRRPLYSESVADYYIESGFGVVETLLGMLSNTISFIRVGAFALNHAGLFVAFATLAHMMKGKAGNISILVLGNVIIIGLEGLIVFIQGLRLEYYELFSKYYQGDGIEFSPVRLKYAKPAADIAVRPAKQAQSLNV